MPLYPLIAFRKAEATCKSLEETAKDTPAFLEALQEEDVARKALAEAAKEQKAALKTLKKAKKDSKELAIAANKAQGATQKALKEGQTATTAPTETNATQAALQEGEALVQTEQVASEIGKGVISITEGGILRIQNAANRINKPIHLVGSRAGGTARITSDFDYVIEGISHKQWTKIKNSLPGSSSRIDNLPSRVDLFKGPLDPARPHITFYPQ